MNNANQNYNGIPTGYSVVTERKEAGIGYSQWVERNGCKVPIRSLQNPELIKGIESLALTQMEDLDKNPNTNKVNQMVFLK